MLVIEFVGLHLINNHAFWIPVCFFVVNVLLSRSIVKWDISTALSFCEVKELYVMDPVDSLPVNFIY